MQVDQDGGPDGLQVAFRAAVVAALAGVVAVDDQAEEPFDAWSGAFEVRDVDGVGELAQRGLAEVFAAVDADRRRPLGVQRSRSGQGSQSVGEKRATRLPSAAGLLRRGL